MEHLLKHDAISLGAGINYVVGDKKKKKKAPDDEMPVFVMGKSQEPELLIQKSRPVKRQMDFQGIPINIEIEPGDIKRGKDPDGMVWKVKYRIPYGNIAGTKTFADSEELDCYIGPMADSEVVYIIHQLKIDGTPDEEKCFLGFTSETDVVKEYFFHGPRWGLGSIDVMDIDSFKEGFLAANRDYGAEKSLVVIDGDVDSLTHKVRKNFEYIEFDGRIHCATCVPFFDKKSNFCKLLKIAVDGPTGCCRDWDNPKAVKWSNRLEREGKL